MSEDIYAINYDYAKQLKEAHKQMYNNPDKVEHRYKKAWEEFRGIIEEQGKHSFQWILTLMDLTIPPPRVYDPDKEWVPVSSGQMPTHSNPIMAQGSLGRMYIYYDRGSLTSFDIAWRNLPERYKGEGCSQ